MKKIKISLIQILILFWKEIYFGLGIKFEPMWFMSTCIFISDPVGQMKFLVSKE